MQKIWKKLDCFLRYKKCTMCLFNKKKLAPFANLKVGKYKKSNLLYKKKLETKEIKKYFSKEFLKKLKRN